LTKAKTLSITARAFNTLVKSDFYDTILGSYVGCCDWMPKLVRRQLGLRTS
jgi:hypothetical protein